LGPKIPAPTCYLDRDASSLEERGLRYAGLLREEIIRQGPESVLAFIMEPVGGATRLSAMFVARACCWHLNWWRIVSPCAPCRRR